VIRTGPPIDLSASGPEVHGCNPKPAAGQDATDLYHVAGLGGAFQPVQNHGERHPVSALRRSIGLEIVDVEEVIVWRADSLAPIAGTVPPAECACYKSVQMWIPQPPGRGVFKRAVSELFQHDPPASTRQN